MNKPSWILVLCFAIVATGCAATPGAPGPDGLAPVASSQMDALYVRPDTDIRSYLQVFIEPVPVKFRSDYGQRHAMNYLLAEPMYAPYQDAQSIAADLAGLMYAGLVDAFKAANYEVVGAPGSGVLHVSAKINDLFINAPDRLSSSVRVTLNRETGEATYFLEASDGASGNVVARVQHHQIVREVSRLNLADDTTNRFWFETAFRRFASNVVDALGASRRTTVSLAN